MSDSEPYDPLSERLSQDVVHDNIVPKYSDLATARPTRLVLAGVWLIFAPMAVGMIGIALSMIVDSPDALTAIVSSVLPTLFFILAIVILFTQTRRYMNADRDTES